MLLAIRSWNLYVENENSDLATLLPNISRFDVAKLYKAELSEFIEDLRMKVQDVAKVQLVTSNPDFVIIKRALADELIGIQNRIDNIVDLQQKCELKVE